LFGQLFHGSKENITHLLDNTRFELMRHDVVDPFKVEIDQIYNLACPASPVHYQHNPFKTVKTSVMKAINALGFGQACWGKDIAGINFRSLRRPGGSPSNGRLQGQRKSHWAKTCYDEGKRCAETLFFDCHRQNNEDIRVIRIFNTYGPRIRPDDGRVVSNFIIQAFCGVKKGNDNHI
jgi:UDP-glucuronate decarboxylase